MELQELIDRIERWKMKSGLGEEAASGGSTPTAEMGFSTAGLVDESFFDDDAPEDETDVAESEEDEALEEVDDETVPSMEDDALVEEEDFDLETEDEKAV